MGSKWKTPISMVEEQIWGQEGDERNGRTGGVVKKVGSLNLRSWSGSGSR